MPPENQNPMFYNALNPQKIVSTIATLEKRISERFTDSSLRNICSELLVIAENAEVKSEWIGRPIFWMRTLVWACCILFLAAILASIYLVSIQVSMVAKQNASIAATKSGVDSSVEKKVAEFIPNLEAELNVLVLLGGAVFFLMTIEGRYKRKRALAAIDELRSIAHIIDMHQLTKDPERLKGKQLVTTLSSPKVGLTKFELRRYLDYCSEMLALVSKIAAIYVQDFDDSVAIASANEVESLTTGLSRKIWQKLLVLHSNNSDDSQETTKIQTP